MTQQRIFEVVYIRSDLATVWDALTNPNVTELYWFGTRIESDWQVGSKVLYIRNSEVTDEHTVLMNDEPNRLIHTFEPVVNEEDAEPASRVRFTLEESGEVVRLTLCHYGFAPDSKVFRTCAEGWPSILSNLKTYLETGAALPEFSFPAQPNRFQQINA